MKLFIVIYIAGQIGATIGPLPYGFDECQIRTMKERARLNPNIITDEGYRASDIEFKCEWHAARPGFTK